MTAGQLLFKYRGLVPAPGLALVAWVTSANLGAASVLPWLAGANRPLWFLAGLAVAVLGQCVRFAALRAIGPKSRVSSKIRTEELVTTGIYSVVRNPLYTGNTLMAVGLAVCTGWYPLMVAAPILLLLYYYAIIRAEEDALAGTFGPEFEAYTARTPRLIPAPHRYRPLVAARRHGMGEWFPRELNTVTALVWTLAVVGRGFAGVPW